MLQDKKQFFAFLQGRGGTGKAHTIRSIVSILKPSQYLLMAATNTSAREIGGETIHKALKLPIHLFDTDSIKYPHYPGLHCVVFDEVSMMSGRLLKILEKALRKMTGKDESFGGCSALLSGDLLQLSIGDDRIFRAEDWYLFDRIELTKSIRHSADQEFADHLSRWAEGEIQPWDLQYFKKRELCPNGIDYKMIAQKFLAFPPGQNAILCSNGAAVEKYNEAVVKELSPNKHSLLAYRDVHQRKMKGLRQPPTYEEQERDGYFLVGKGLTVIFTGQMVSIENIRVKSGTYGVIDGYEMDRGIVNLLRILIQGKPYHFVCRHEELPRYGDLHSLVSQRFELTNSYAFVVHRAQGMTLDKVIVDTSDGLGTSMGYSAFSRVRTGADLFVTHLPQKSHYTDLRNIIKSDDSVDTALVEQSLLNITKPEEKEKPKKKMFYDELVDAIENHEDNYEALDAAMSAFMESE